MKQNSIWKPLLIFGPIGVLFCVSCEKEETLPSNLALFRYVNDTSEEISIEVRSGAKTRIYDPLQPQEILDVPIYLFGASPKIDSDLWMFQADSVDVVYDNRIRKRWYSDTDSYNGYSNRNPISPFGYSFQRVTNQAHKFEYVFTFRDPDFEVQNEK